MQLLLRLLAVGDVLGDMEHPGELAFSVKNGGDRHQEGADDGFHFHFPGFSRARFDQAFKRAAFGRFIKFVE